jgi:hypothetical protein
MSLNSINQAARSPSIGTEAGRKNTLGLTLIDHLAVR